MAVVKNAPGFSSEVGKRVVRKDSPFQGHNILFRRGGIVSPLLGPLDLGVRKRGVLIQEEVTNLSLKRELILSFRVWIRGFHNLLKENQKPVLAILEQG